MIAPSTLQQVNTPIPSNNYYNNADELPVDGADSEYQLSDASGGNQSQAHSNAVPSINGEFLLLLLMIFHLSLYLYWGLYTPPPIPSGFLGIPRESTWNDILRDISQTLSILLI